MSRIDLTGMTFGTWTVLSYSRYSYQPLWLCRCICGAEREVSGAGLRTGGSTNCGCQRKSRQSHGDSRVSGPSGRTYRIWKNMRSRCKPEYKQASDYAGRGISVCARWESYEAFVQDMGKCPAGMSLDREDNDKGYTPDNCRWATPAMQRRNSRRIVPIVLDGTTMPLKDAAASIGVSDAAIHQERKRNGGTAQEAFERVRDRHR